MVAHRGERGLFVGGTGDGVGRLGSGEAFTDCSWFCGDALAGWRELLGGAGCGGAVCHRV